MIEIALIDSQSIVQNVQSPEEVLEILKKDKHLIRTCRANILFTTVQRRNEMPHGFGQHSSQYYCFILPTEEILHALVHEYIIKHNPCFDNAMDLACAIYSKETQRNHFNIISNGCIRPIYINEHEKLLLNRYYEYHFYDASAQKMTIYYMDLKDKTLQSFATEWRNQVHREVMSHIQAGRELFFKIVKNASVLANNCVQSDEVLIEYEPTGAIPTPFANTPYAQLTIQNETYTADTEVDLYLILDKYSHLINL